MANDNLQDKTEKPTPRRKEEARKKGQVATSREIPSVFVIFSGLAILWLMGPFIYFNIRNIMQSSFLMIADPELDLTQLIVIVNRVAGKVLFFIVPYFLVILGAGLLSTILQTGIVFSGESIIPRISRLNPIKGFGRLFSWYGLVELTKSIIKILVVGTVSYIIMKKEVHHILPLSHMEVRSIFLYVLKVSLKIFLYASIAMVFLAILDFAFQKWQFFQKLKMTKHELKEEFKRTEGDPLIKSRIRKVQYQMARRRMMQEVPKADVVVTNPTQLALALQYKSDVMSAPTVIAKGAGVIAQRIKEVAQEHDVPIVENKELAQNLYKTVEIGSEIPSVFYQAVAEVLAYVYRMKGKAI